MKERCRTRSEILFDTLGIGGGEGRRFWCCEIRFGLECFGSNQALDTKKTTRSSDSERTYCYDEGRFVQVLLFSPVVRFRGASEISNTEDE